MTRLQQKSTAVFKCLFVLFAVMSFVSAFVGIFVGSKTFYGGSFWLPFFYLVGFLGLGFSYYKHFSEKKSGFPLALAMCFGFRLLAVCLLQLEPFSDFKIYHDTALLLAEGTPFRDAYVSSFPHIIGFSEVLSWCYRMFGANIFVVQLGNVLIETATALMLYLCVKRLFSRKIANFTTFLYAISPSFIFYSEFLATEILFTFLLMVLFYLSLRFWEKGSVTLGILFGILAAISNCIRPCGMILLLAFAIYTFIIVIPKKRFLSLTLAVLCYLGCNMGLYRGIEMINGQSIAHMPIGYNLYIGSNADTNGQWNATDDAYAKELIGSSDISPDRMHKRLWEEGFLRYRENGIYSNVKLGFLKFGITWGTQMQPAVSLRQSSDFAFWDAIFQFGNLSNAFHLILMFGILVGAVRLRRKKEHNAVMFLCIFTLGVAAVHLLAETQERYSYGALAMMMPVAALGLCRSFEACRNVFSRLREDINAVMEKDPAAKNKLEVFLLSPGIHALFWHRAAHRLYLKKRYFLARSLSQLTRLFTGVEIHPGAKIGRGVMIDHGMGVVIGETAEVGDGCTIYQNVTLGGTGKDTGKRHPTIGKNVMIGSGAKVLGPFTVGDNSKIAANAVVLREVPENSTCVGVPARVVIRNNVKVSGADWQTDQTHIPDPLSQELCRMLARIEKLEADNKKPEADVKTEKGE
ncbi:MAG: serine O-acetyltransferase [Clostridia bacterium]|nr:serine O-acetyltransferase [Clostridia bacterium]